MWIKMAVSHNRKNISGFILLTITAVFLVSLMLYLVYEKEGNLPTPRRIVPRVFVQPKFNVVQRLTETSVINSNYFVLNRKDVYYISDKIQVLIEARDINGSLEQTGGAYFRAKLISEDIKASSRSDGEIIDYGNGTYLAEFILRWPGRVRVAVMLVDSSAAVNILERMRKEFPNRGSYTGHFKNGSDLESTTCNVDHVAPKDKECDFTDSETNIHWYCERPTNPNLYCEHWWKHNSNNTYIFEQQTKYLRAGEEKHFATFKQYLQCKDCEINVQEKQNAGHNGNTDKYGRYSWQEDWTSLPNCLPGHIKKFDNITSGYLYKGKWYSTRCQNRKFDVAGATRCLRNKTVLILADSTGKQLYTYLVDLLKLRDIPPVDCMLHARREDINFTIYDKFHGLPSRGSHGGPSACLRQSVVNVLDHMTFIPDVFILSIGAHFSIHTMDLLKQRLVIIRAAVERLHRRNPKTLFIIKSANTREFQNLSHKLSNNEWYIYTLDRLVREMFSGYPRVAIVDAWDMTVTQFCPDNVHPKRETLSNIVDMTLSYICPAQMIRNKN